jgi:hypothetical protein
MLPPKTKILVFIVLLVIVVVCITKILPRDSVAVAVDAQFDDCRTDGVMVYEYETIDTLMFGKWQHITDTTWFRVYTSEPAGEGYCWGREWDTSEDIYEEDLTPYGNGWFKWKKEDEAVVEIQMTEINGTIIPYEYNVLQLNTEQLQFKENFSSKKHLFRKI